MTTEAAARLYEAQHLFEVEGRGWAVYNPNNINAQDLPTIYGFNNGGSTGWYSAVLVAQDGTGLGSHVCSSEAYMPHDLGVLEGSRPDRHEIFREHYPNGYKMEFISMSDVLAHEGLTEAYRLNQIMREESEKKEGI